MENTWMDLESALRNLGKLEREDIAGTGLVATAIETLFKDGDLTPEDMAAELTEAIREAMEAKGQRTKK